MSSPSRRWPWWPAWTKEGRAPPPRPRLNAADGAHGVSSNGRGTERRREFHAGDPDHRPGIPSVPETDPPDRRHQSVAGEKGARLGASFAAAQATRPEQLRRVLPAAGEREGTRGDADCGRSADDQRDAVFP